MGDIILALQTGNHRNQFFLKGGISRLDNCLSRKKQTHYAECQKNCPCDNRAEKSQLPV